MISSINGEKLFGICLFLVLLSFCVMYGSEFRYIKYFVLPVTFFIWFLSEGFLKFRVPNYAYALISFVIISLFYMPFIGISVLKEPLLVFSCLFPFLLIKDLSFRVNKVFFITIAFFFIANITRLEGFFEIGGVEDNFSFVFGLFAVYYSVKKDYKKAFICVLLVVITLKRIALLGVFASVFFIFSPTIIKRFLHPLIFVILNLLGLLVSVLFVVGFFDEFIVSFFGVHPAVLSSGRYALQQLVGEELFYNFTSFIATGTGPGGAVLLSSISFGQEVLLHNDVMKICIEFGLFYFLLFFFLFYHGLNYEQKVLAVYLNITFFTDNTLIYAGVLFFYFYLSSKLSESPEH